MIGLGETRPAENDRKPRKNGPTPRWITVTEAYRERLRDAEDVIAMQKAAIEEMAREQTRKASHPPVPTCCYPIVVISDRYEGAYSGGRWIAFIDHDREGPVRIGSQSGLPEAAQAYWDRHIAAWWIGVGNTPNLAVAHLMGKALSECLAEHTE